jgi:RNA polymerase primary sigma factor
MNSIPEYDEWQADPTPDNMARVVKVLEPTINSEIQRYTGPKPVLRGRAKVLTAKAIRNYDPTHGAQLRSWVVTQLQPLSRYGQQMRPVHASEMAIRQAAEANRISGELSDELGRDATLEEVADATGLSKQRIKQLRERVTATVNEGMFDTQDDESNAGLPGTGQSDVLGAAEDIVYDSLTPRDKSIYDWKAGRHGKTQLANQVIAKRLGVTPALVSQRSQQIAMQIRNIALKGL